jgi:hypothetical protein
MLAKKTLHQMALIAAVGTLGSTALADYDCFETGTITGSDTFKNVRCPASGTALSTLHAERERINGSLGAYNKWWFNVYRYGSQSNLIWTTAFAFDSNGWELASCSVWPSIAGYNSYTPATGFCAYTEDDEDDGDFVRPVEFHVYGAQD